MEDLSSNVFADKSVFGNDEFSQEYLEIIRTMCLEKYANDVEIKDDDLTKFQEYMLFFEAQTRLPMLRFTNFRHNAFAQYTLNYTRIPWVEDVEKWYNKLPKNKVIYPYVLCDCLNIEDLFLCSRIFYFLTLCGFTHYFRGLGYVTLETPIFDLTYKGRMLPAFLYNKNIPKKQNEQYGFGGLPADLDIES